MVVGQSVMMKPCKKKIQARVSHEGLDGFFVGESDMGTDRNARREEGFAQ